MEQPPLPTMDIPIQERVHESVSAIEGCTQAFKPSSRWVLWSGGYDSWVVTHLCMSRLDFDGVLFIDTGIGIPAVREAVEKRCIELGWNLEVYEAASYRNASGARRPQIYEELVIPKPVRRGELSWLQRGGFPGPTQTGHGKMFDRLKGRAIEHFVRDKKTQVSVAREGLPVDEVESDRFVEQESGMFERHRQYDRIMLVTGVYAAESTRRFANLSGQTYADRSGSKLWVNPCMFWGARDFDAYRNGCEEKYYNPAYDTLGMSGECLCGAFAKPNELNDVEITDRDTYDRICGIEQDAYSHGYCWGWDEGPPKCVIDAKKALRENDGQLEIDHSSLRQVCHNCYERYWATHDANSMQRAWNTDERRAHTHQELQRLKSSKLNEN